MNSCCNNCRWYEETKPQQCSGFCSYRHMGVTREFDCDGFIDKRVDVILRTIQYEIHQRKDLFRNPVIVLSYYLFKMIQTLNDNYCLSYDSNHNLTLFGIKMRRTLSGSELFYIIGDETNFDDAGE